MPLHLSENKITNNLEVILLTGSSDPTGSSIPSLYTKESGGNSELFFKDADLNVLQITENGSLKDALTVSGAVGGDLLQFDGSLWQARGGSADPVTGTPEFENLTVQSDLSADAVVIPLTDVDAQLTLDTTYGDNVLVLSVPISAGAEFVIELNNDPIPGTWDYDFNAASFDSAGKDLGSNTFKWKDGYFSGDLNVDGEVIAGTGTCILRGDRLTLKVNSGLLGAASGDIWIDNPSGLEEVLLYYDTPGGGNRTVLSDNTSFGGDVSGAYNSLVVKGLNTKALAGNTLSDQYNLIYNSSAGKWEEVDHVGAGDNITIPLWSFSNGSGTWGITSLSTAFQGGYLDNSPGGSNNGDKADFTIFLGRGTYSFYTISRYTNGSGILDILLDSNSIGTTIDTYSGIAMLNQINSVTSVAITTAKWYTVSLSVNGKNPASGGYAMYIQGFAIVRTGV